MEKEKAPDKVRFPYLLLVFSVLFVIGLYFYLSGAVRDALSEMVRVNTENANATVTRIFINEVYPDLQNELMLTYDRQQTKDSLTADELTRVDQRVRKFMIGTDILKTKIYNINGVTVYSSDASQIGETKTDNRGFNLASRGDVTTQVTYRGQFSAFDGEVYDKNLIASYVPIHGENRKIIGVAEIYTDRTVSLGYVEEMLMKLQAVMVPSLAVVLLLIALISWRIFHVSTRSHLDTLDNIGR
jgi:hypothetical protein